MCLLGCSFDYFSVIRPRLLEVCCYLILIYIFPPGLVVFLEVALYSFNIWHDHVTYKNDIWEYKKRVIINHITYSSGIILFVTRFRDCSRPETWKSNVLNLPCEHVIKGHVNQWLYTTSFFPHLVYMSFLKLWHNNEENW